MEPNKGNTERAQNDTNYVLNRRKNTRRTHFENAAVLTSPGHIDKSGQGRSKTIRNVISTGT